MAGALVLMIILGGFALLRFAIGKLWFEATREKLEDEKKKNEYLKSKYKHIEKEPRVKAILVLVPKKKSGNWTVEKMVKKGVFPRDYTVNEFVAEISDRELSQIIREDKRKQQQKTTKRQVATKNKPIEYFPIDEVSIIISPRVSPKGIVTFYDLAGNRVPGIPKTPKEKALQWKCFLGKKTFKKVQRWVPVNASHVEPYLNDLDFINAHSIKPIKELKPFKRASNSELTMKVPSPGESISEVEISAWYVTTGDYVEKDQAIAEFDTEKATLELPAEAAGRITILVKEGRTIKVGAACCVIDTSANAPNTKTEPQHKTKTSEVLATSKLLEPEMAKQNYNAIPAMAPVESKALDFDIDCSHLTKTEFSDTYESKYGNLTGYGRFKTPTALYIGNYKAGDLNGYAEAYQNDGTVLKGEFVDGEMHKGEIKRLEQANGSECFEAGYFKSFELNGKGVREFRGDVTVKWDGNWKNGEFESGNCTTEGSSNGTIMFHRRQGNWHQFKLFGTAREFLRKTTPNEIERIIIEGEFANDRLVEGRMKTSSYDYNPKSKVKTLIAEVEVIAKMTEIHEINKKGKYSKAESAIEPTGKLELNLRGGSWDKGITIKGEMNEGVLTALTDLNGPDSDDIIKNELVGMSFYDIINQPPLRTKFVSQEKMKDHMRDLERENVVMVFRFPDGSYSHAESGNMKNGEFIPDEESLKLRREQFGSEELP